MVRELFDGHQLNETKAKKVKDEGGVKNGIGDYSKNSYSSFPHSRSSCCTHSELYFSLLIKNIMILRSILIAVIFFKTSNAFYPKVSVFNQPELVQKWSKASKTFDSIGWIHREPYMKILDRLISELESSKIVSPPCQESLKDIKQGVIDRKLWAYESEF